MSVLCKPALVYPPYKIDQQGIINVLSKLHPDHPQWEMIETLIRNTKVERRNLIRPIEEVVRFEGFEQRNNIFTEECKKMSIEACEMALINASLDASAIDMIIVTSCTGFMMPSITAYLISKMNFRNNTRQLPIAQLGCVAGCSAINRAYDYISLFPKHNVLLLTVEFSSLCFQQSQSSISSFISNSIFGDCVTACVMKGGSAAGYKVTRSDSYLLKNTEHYIAYVVKDSGYHFILDKEVMHSIKKVSPVLMEFISRDPGLTVNDLDFCIFHTGGRRILDELVLHLSLDNSMVQPSRDSLLNNGNIASGVIFDVLSRQFDGGQRRDGDIGLMAAFGPGFTAEYNIGQWIEG